MSQRDNRIIPDPCRPIGLLYHDDGIRRVWMRDKRWSCSYCGPRKARDFLRRIRNETFYSLLTITLGGDGRPTRENFQRLARANARIRQVLRRTYGRERGATWSREQGPDSTKRIHQHVALGVHPTAKVRRRCESVARRAGAGFLKFKRVRDPHGARVGRYLAKYLFKEASRASAPGSDLWPRYTRRAQTTAPVGEKELGWHAIHNSWPWKSRWNSFDVKGTADYYRERLGMLRLRLVPVARLRADDLITRAKLGQRRETVS